ncbi:P-loop containing nucleoside triphosphate hydrolase protein [Obelidium mucronatum]|nr:P-loop containing nucleoside triphosphate hydrolase protein [Obelidium mucronatum]
MLQTLVSLPLLRPELFQTGILAKHSIAGAPGKTLLAKAAAKSSGANFLSVSLSDIFDKYVGEGEKNVRAVFTLARKLSPCVVFLDEVDALFSARRGGDSGNGAKREVINEFMAEWDGLHSRNEGVIVLGATNRPFDLDDAILRRMPRRVLVDLPTEAQRLQILQVHLKDELLHESISLADIAKRTALYSGSDLKNVAISAALASVKEHILRESLPSAPENQAEISSAEILKKLESLDDWKSIVNSSAAIAPSTRTTLVTPAKRLLTNLHFEIALKEVPPSLTDEMQTLVELRKWDEKFGDSGALGGKKGKKQGWGFAAGENKH